MEKKIFIAATRQNEGKTMTSLGLISALLKRNMSVGFIKPVGQRYLEVDGHKIDEDSILIDKVFDLGLHLKDMSPVAVERDFTRKYIMEPNVEQLIEQIKKSYALVMQNRDIVVIEGTGHAGVGSVFDLSNATVAKMLNAKVIIVSSGGIGRPIDEIILNQALFHQAGVEIIGAIINKIEFDALDKIAHFVQLGLKRKGIELLGVVPFRPILTAPTVRQILEELGGDLMNGETELDNTIEKIVVGAMTPHHALDYFDNKTLVITPGDREDLILAAMSSCVSGIGKTYCVSGMLLTGDLYPHQTIQRLIQRTTIPVIAVKDNTFETATKVHDILVKIRPEDKEKIAIATKLVDKYINIDKILNNI
ncbi:MAG: AAA family ATPase [bacterium]|nr:AAA family ATPase [bacterium]